MNPTPKKCKGINKAHGFKGCGEVVTYRKYGLCASCLVDWMNETEEGEKYLQSVRIVSKKRVEKEEKKKKKIAKDNETNWREKLQTKLQEIARLIDIGQPCLARGYHANQLHGGHVFSKGSNKTMALNLHNIHRQSAQSNHFQNEDGLFREGLKNEYGIHYYEFLFSLQQTPAIKYLNIEYQEFYKHACKIANKLKKDGQLFTSKQRIEKRNNINIQLGIYGNAYCIYSFKVSVPSI